MILPQVVFSSKKSKEGVVKKKARKLNAIELLQNQITILARMYSKLKQIQIFRSITN